MKKLTYLILLLSAFAQSQVVTIPDANFKNALLFAANTNGVAKDSNGLAINIMTRKSNFLKRWQCMSWTSALRTFKT